MLQNQLGLSLSLERTVGAQTIRRSQNEWVHKCPGMSPQTKSQWRLAEVFPGHRFLFKAAFGRTMWVRQLVFQATSICSSDLEGWGTPKIMSQRQEAYVFWRSSKKNATNIKSKLIHYRGFVVDAALWGWRKWFSTCGDLSTEHCTSKDLTLCTPRAECWSKFQVQLYEEESPLTHQQGEVHPSKVDGAAIPH